MNEYFVNVIVGSEDSDGNMNPYGCVVYRFNIWQEAADFIKLSLDNGLLVEARIPNSVRDDQVV